MTLMREMLRMWEQNAELQALCPVDRVRIGDQEEEQKSDPEYPYVVIVETSETQIGRSSDSFYDEMMLSVVVYAQTKTEARKIQKASRDVYRKTDPNPNVDGTVINMEKRGGTLDKLPGQIWMAMDEYAVQTQRSR